ncbi:transposase [Pararhizobium capsulatum DSM 1112]|uniref:Transposase n=1 Tax=Pararhizobium capsulatum DSM 1112 TaxID=1121113 RepID=A0ABU0BVN9_9HYPH|nr:transposase [Pararhizobium capsulatum DSM 1112]
MILDLHQQGLTVSAISRETGIERKTVRKYIERGIEVTAYGPRKPRATVIDPFASYLRERVKPIPVSLAVGSPKTPGSRLCRRLHRRHRLSS